MAESRQDKGFHPDRHIIAIYASTLQKIECIKGI